MINSPEQLLAALTIDAEEETAKIVRFIKNSLAKDLKKRGVVLGVSGGIDSSVTLALCARAVGPQRVCALQMPERHCLDDTDRLGALAASHYEVSCIREDITPVLEGVGFYRRYVEAARLAVPEYTGEWKSKLVVRNVLESRTHAVFSLVAQAPDGNTTTRRLGLEAYLSIVAATNFKQRIRKMVEYYHADRRNFAVVGTPNLLEYDQGFFVKNGDGAADIKPIAHLYKTQVYQLAQYLDVPEEIRTRPPTTDTYSLEQGQDEFFFSLPWDKMDVCLLGKNNDCSPEIVAAAAGISEQQLRRVYEDIDAKRRSAGYLHMAPLTLIENL